MEVELKKFNDKETLYERFLCYRALILAVLGNLDEADALRSFIRDKKETKYLLQARLEKAS